MAHQKAGSHDRHAGRQASIPEMHMPAYLAHRSGTSTAKADGARTAAAALVVDAVDAQRLELRPVVRCRAHLLHSAPRMAACGTPCSRSTHCCRTPVSCMQANPAGALPQRAQRRPAPALQLSAPSCSRGVHCRQHAPPKGQFKGGVGLQMAALLLRREAVTTTTAPSHAPAAAYASSRHSHWVWVAAGGCSV